MTILNPSANPGSEDPPPRTGTRSASDRPDFEVLFDAAAIPLCLIDGQGAVLHLNERFEQTFGYTREDVATLGDWWRLACPDAARHESAQTRCDAAIRVALANGGDLEPVEIEITCKRGDVRSVVVMGNAVDGDVLLVFHDVTARQTAEHELRLVNVALNKVRDSAFLVDRNGAFRLVNEAACRSLGYAPDELLRMTVADVDIAPEFALERWHNHWEELRAQGSLLLESRHRTKDGRTFPVEVSASLFEFGGEHFNLALVRDITRRKQTEADNQRNLRLLRGMDRINRTIKETEDFEQVLNSVLDDVLDIFDCDRAFMLYPCDPDAPTWSVPFERTRPEHPGVLELGLTMAMDPHVSRTLAALLAATGPVKFGPGSDHPLPASASEQFGMRSILSVVLRPKLGKPWQFGIHQCSYAREWSAEDERLFEEISRRLTDGLTGLLAHRELRERESQFRTLVENSPDNIIRYDAECRQTYANPAVAQVLVPLLGRNPDGETPDEAHPDGSFRDYEAGLRRVIATGEREEFELVLPDRGEGPRHHAIRFAAERNAAGGIVGAIAFGRDVTELRRQSEQLRRLNRELRAISDCNQALIRAADEQSLLSEICRIIVDEAGYRMAWVAYLDGDPLAPRPVASAGDDSGYVAEALSIRAALPDSNPPPAVAARTGEITGVTDFAVDASAAPWREAALRRGYRSSISLPLKDQNRVFALLAIYSAEPAAFTPEERRMLGELAEDLAFGITALRAHTERVEAEKKIEHLAFYDVLTDLPNRRLFLDRLQQAMAGSVRTERYGALLYIDMDNFKVINDTCGHDVGDQLLVEVTARLSSCLRDGDTISRLGGDEFVAMLEDLGDETSEAAAKARIVANKILAALNQPYAIAGRRHHCTPSIGVTLFTGSDDSVDELLKQADIAMYQAKAAGRNTLRFFDPEMQATVSARAAMELDLRRAIEEGQFALHYQPQVDDTGRILGAEALLRWQHPEKGAIPPGRFIPLAEESDLILSIGRWVLEEACARLALWARDPHLRHLRLAVNVSARQFRQRDFVDTVRTVIEGSGITTGQLKLELTETLVLENVEDTIEKMSALEDLGVGFSMDDFGTGFSSLAYLTRLPLDQLKIDQSFVRRLPDNPTDAVVARSIISLATSLGLTVIAEGVETEAQRSFLAKHGCPIYQGYLFSRPLPLPEFMRLVGQTKTPTI